MNFISKEIAMSYLMGNEMIFSKIKASFLNSYINHENDFPALMERKNLKDLELYIHSIKGISLNLGAKVLYDTAVEALVHIRKELYDEKTLNSFFIALKGTYIELSQL